jgi:hypothetical protein
MVEKKVCGSKQALKSNNMPILAAIPKYFQVLYIAKVDHETFLLKKLEVVIINADYQNISLTKSLYFHP